MAFTMYMSSLPDIQSVYPMSCIDAVTVSQGGFVELYFL